jgi:hypothetical protein
LRCDLIEAKNSWSAVGHKNKKRRNVRNILAAIVLASAHAAEAATCIQIANLKGQAAYSADNYAFAADGMAEPALRRFCYDGEHGRFDHMEGGVFTKFGLNTWIWFNAVEGRTEVAEVWSFDLTRRKALFARTRGAGYIFPATAGAYIGDITAIRSE